MGKPQAGRDRNLAMKHRDKLRKRAEKKHEKTSPRSRVKASFVALRSLGRLEDRRRLAATESINGKRHANTGRRNQSDTTPADAVPKHKTRRK